MTVIDLDFKLFTLELVLTPEKVPVEKIVSMSDEGWEAILKLTGQHRLFPLMLQQWKPSPVRQYIPKHVMDAVERQHRKRVTRQLHRIAAMHQVHSILAGENIQHAFLKGAFLALQSYPSPYSRPMRDIDVLIPAAEVLDAFSVLEKAGFIRKKNKHVNLESAILSDKHLPPLHSVDDGTMIELHSSLFCHDDISKNHPDISDSPDMWNRVISRQVNQQNLPYMSPTDLLLHIIVHSSYDHFFDNGPLIITDVHYLLDKETIDWSLFWKLAQETGRTRGAIMVLTMVEYFYGNQPINWQNNQTDIPVDTFKLTLGMLLRDSSRKNDVNLGEKLSSTSSKYRKIALLGQRLFPEKKQLAKEYNLKENSIVIYFYYIPKLYKLLVKRLPERVRYQTDTDLISEQNALHAFKQWLAS